MEKNKILILLLSGINLFGMNYNKALEIKEKNQKIVETRNEAVGIVHTLVNDFQGYKQKETFETTKQYLDNAKDIGTKAILDLREKAKQHENCPFVINNLKEENKILTKKNLDSLESFKLLNQEHKECSMKTKTLVEIEKLTEEINFLKKKLEEFRKKSIIVGFEENFLEDLTVSSFQLKENKDNLEDKNEIENLGNQIKLFEGKLKDAKNLNKKFEEGYQDNSLAEQLKKLGSNEKPFKIEKDHLEKDDLEKGSKYKEEIYKLKRSLFLAELNNNLTEEGFLLKLKFKKDRAEIFKEVFAKIFAKRFLSRTYHTQEAYNNLFFYNDIFNDFKEYFEKSQHSETDDLLKSYFEDEIKDKAKSSEDFYKEFCEEANFKKHYYRMLSFVHRLLNEDENNAFKEDFQAMFCLLKFIEFNIKNKIKHMASVLFEKNISKEDFLKLSPDDLVKKIAVGNEAYFYENHTGKLQILFCSKINQPKDKIVFYSICADIHGSVSPSPFILTNEIKENDSRGFSEGPLHVIHGHCNGGFSEINDPAFERDASVCLKEHSASQEKFKAVEVKGEDTKKYFITQLPCSCGENIYNGKLACEKKFKEKYGKNWKEKHSTGRCIVVYNPADDKHYILGTTFSIPNTISSKNIIPLIKDIYSEELTKIFNTKDLNDLGGDFIDINAGDYHDRGNSTYSSANEAFMTLRFACDNQLILPGNHENSQQIIAEGRQGRQGLCKDFLKKNENMGALYGDYIDALSSVSPKSCIISGQILVAHDAMPLVPYKGIYKELKNYYLIDSSPYFEKIKEKVDDYSENDILWSDNNYFAMGPRGLGKLVDPITFKKLYDMSKNK